MIHWFSKARFQTKLVLGLVTILSLTWISTGVFTYMSQLTMLESDFGRQLAHANLQASARLELKVKELYRVYNSLMFNTEFEANLLLVTSEDTPKTQKYDAFRRLSQMLSQVKYDISYVRGLYLMDLEGNYQETGLISEDFLLDHPTNSKLLEELEDTNGDPIWRFMEFPIMGSAVPREKLVLARYLYNNRMEAYGTIVMILDPAYFKDFFEGLVTGTDNGIFVLDNHSKVLLTNWANNASPTEEIFRSIAMENGSGQMKDTFNGQTYLYTWNRSDDTDFMLVNRISLSEIHGKYWIILERNIIIGAMGIALSILLIMLHTGRLLHPLRRLVEAMQRMRQGDFNTRVEVRSKDELNFIGDSFNAMAENVNSLIREVYVRQLNEREAELKAFQAQLNPHFLYNTLNGLYWKLILEDNPDSAEQVSSLSELLKYSLESVNKATSLRDELQQVRRYLMIQRTFLQEDFESIIQAEEEVLDCKVIRLLIQPLIENVFVHAFRNMKGHKILLIQVVHQEEQLRITIRDNGVGMDEEMLNRLMSSQTEQDGSRERVGVRSVLRRVDLMYGPPFGVYYASEVGKGTTVEVIVPFEPIDGKEAVEVEGEAVVG